MLKTILGLGLIVMSWAAHADLSVSPPFLNFQSAPVGGYGSTGYVYVRNNGQDTVAIQEYNTCGSDYRVYNYCYQLPAGQQCEIAVQFAPSREGYLSCGIYVSDGSSRYSINVSGQGTRR